MAPALSSLELRILLDVVAAIAYDGDRDAFAVESLAAVMEAVRASAITYAVVAHGRPCSVLFRFEVGRFALQYRDDFDARLVEFCCQHPLDRTCGAAGDVRLTWDLVTRRALLASDWFRGFGEPCARMPQAKIFLPRRADGAARALVVDCRARDFGARERLLLEILAPHLVRPIERADSLRAKQRARGLTDRELEVLELVRAGLSNRDVGALLVVSTSTVRKHLEHAYAKLGAHSRAQAVTRAWQSAGTQLARAPVGVAEATYHVDARGLELGRRLRAISLARPAPM